MSRLSDWLKIGRHLPEPLRDFHDAKRVFKHMHTVYRDEPQQNMMPTWMEGRIYVIDWFLWYMASRGYTLQKTRKQNVQFLEFPE